MSDESKRTWLTHPGKPGVVYREHPTRKIARKPDRFWAIRHRAEGKRLIETLGWTSEGWTADMAHALLVELQRNAKLGQRPQTLKEKRKMAADAKAQAARQSAMEDLKEITFGELAGFYREWASVNRRSGASVARILDRHILPELGGKKAADITPATVNELKAILEAKRPERGRGRNDPDARLSAQTVLHCLKTVREVYNYALETPHPAMPERMLYTGKNPAVLSRRGRGVRVPANDARRLRILTDAEIARRLRMGRQQDGSSWICHQEHWSLGGQQSKFALRWELEQLPRVSGQYAHLQMRHQLPATPGPQRIHVS